MVKKLQKMAQKKAASAAGLLDSQLAQTVKDSAQQIWLAGLGAFAKAQGEGNKVFDTLMKEGLNLHRLTQSPAGEKLGDVAGRMSAMAGQVGSQANAQWDKLESIFEERTARALARLGVPTARDVQALTERVDALAAALAALGAGPAAAAPRARGGARKTATGPATPDAAAGPAARKATTRKRAAAKPAAPAPVEAPAPASPPAKKARARKPAALA